jgi:peptidoglycan/LPS O-acetylase OafA/YrhL
MPEPVRAGQRYMPGLDGLRALAVLAVVAYHLNLGWAPGGLLGVGVFFTLSGYLITDLLLSQWETTGRMRLADFWRRRARRLLPALFVMLALVAAWVTLLDRSQPPAAGLSRPPVTQRLYPGLPKPSLSGRNALLQVPRFRIVGTTPSFPPEPH